VTDEELQQIEKAAEAATPGPWEYLPEQTGIDPETGPWGEPFGVSMPCPEHLPSAERCAFSTIHDRDSQFIALAREAVPKLVAEVRLLRQQRAEERGAFSRDMSRYAKEVNFLSAEKSQAQADLKTARDALDIAQKGFLDAIDELKIEPCKCYETEAGLSQCHTHWTLYHAESDVRAALDRLEKAAG
jgi:hypothetical protein